MKAAGEVVEGEDDGEAAFGEEGLGGGPVCVVQGHSGADGRAALRGRGW